MNSGKSLVSNTLSVLSPLYFVLDTFASPNLNQKLVQKLKIQTARHGTLELGFGFRLYANKSILKVLIFFIYFLQGEKFKDADIEIFESVAEDNNLDSENGS